MARTGYECRILNIDLDDFLSKLESLDAKNKGERLQRRFVYDFNPIKPDSWIKLHHSFKHGSVSIDIDLWSLILTDVEVEDSSEREVLDTLKLVVERSKVTTKNILSTVQDYGIDIFGVPSIILSIKKIVNDTLLNARRKKLIWG